MGKTRSKQLRLKEGDYSVAGSTRMGDKVLNVQVRNVLATSQSKFEVRIKG